VIRALFLYAEVSYFFLLVEGDPVLTVGDPFFIIQPEAEIVELVELGPNLFFDGGVGGSQEKNGCFQTG
jgi:hypothetical protein